MSYSKQLLSHNTMRIDAKCLGIIPIFDLRNIHKILVEGLSPLRVIGGGSNILLTSDINAYVLKNEIKGIEIIDEDAEQVLVKVGGGENWHQFVMWAISHGLGGIENLALIPGCVGAAPMQNIGAYGVEQVDTFHSLIAVDLKDGISQTFYKEDCNFGYRESIFKHEAKDRYFITHVMYRLQKSPTVHVAYGDIQNWLDQYNISVPSIRDVADAIMAIRKSKLPDPAVLPNTGSFFKNPIVPLAHLNELKESHPDIVSYQVDDQHVKIPAAWLIERCGYKGKRYGDAATHKSHALVLVNHGNASGKQMMEFANEIAGAVKAQFGVEIVPEVNLW